LKRDLVRLKEYEIIIIEHYFTWEENFFRRKGKYLFLMENKYRGLIENIKCINYLNVNKNNTNRS